MDRVDGGHCTQCPQEAPDVACIVVVAADSDLRDMLAEFLLGWGYAVELTRNADELFGSFESGRPELVVLDLALRDEILCPLTRLMDGHVDVPTLLLTNHESGNIPLPARRRQNTARLTKPFHPRDLREIISGFLR